MAETLHFDIDINDKPARKAVKRMQRQLWWLKWGAFTFGLIGATVGTVLGNAIYHGWIR